MLVQPRVSPRNWEGMMIRRWGRGMKLWTRRHRMMLWRLMPWHGLRWEWRWRFNHWVVVEITDVWPGCCGPSLKQIWPKRPLSENSSFRICCRWHSEKIVFHTPKSALCDFRTWSVDVWQQRQVDLISKQLAKPDECKLEPSSIVGLNSLVLACWYICKNSWETSKICLNLFTQYPHACSCTSSCCLHHYLVENSLMSHELVETWIVKPKFWIFKKQWSKAGLYLMWALVPSSVEKCIVQN